MKERVNHNLGAQMPEDHIKALYVQQWGNPTSIALLDPNCTIFKVTGIDGVIAYRDEPSCVVVFGDPICDSKDVYHLAQAFYDFCEYQKKTIVYAVISDHFMNILKEQNAWSIIEMGNELILNPQQDPRVRTGNYANLLRRKTNYAARDGIQVKEYTGHNKDTETMIEEVADAWLKGRTGRQIYLVQVNMFAGRSTKRYFYAEDSKTGAMIGVLMLTRLDAYQGWVINLLITVPGAASYVSEVLALSALDALRVEGCHYFSTGMVPDKGLGIIHGMHPITTWLLRRVYGLVSRWYRLADKMRYWKKFGPHPKPTYMAFSTKSFKVKDVFTILRAFHAEL
jgi:lysylphosphatidylglycerol synthetase-like protein (DUF2156 family)